MRDPINSLTKKYALAQAFFWVCFMIILEFSGIFLLGSGLSNTMIGLLLALSGLLSAILQPAIASYADNSKSPSVKTFLFLFIIGMVLISVILLFLHRHILLIAFLYGAWIVILQVLTPFHNALATETINQGKTINIGFTRAIASLVCGIVSYFFGTLTDRFGIRMFPLAILFFIVLYLVTILSFPFQKIRSNDSDPRNLSSNNALKKASKKDVGLPSGIFTFFRKYNIFSIALIGCTCLYISHILLVNFTYQIILTKGGGTYESGIAIMIGAFAEIPALMAFSALLRKKKAGFWIVISGIFYTVRAISSLLVQSVTAFYLVELLQMTSWAILSLAVVYYVNDCMQAKDTIKGQAYMAATYTIAIVLGSSLGGLLIDRFGVRHMLLFASATAAIGLFLVYLAIIILPKKRA